MNPYITDLIRRVEEEIAKQGKNVQLAASVAKDFAIDKAIERAPLAALTALGKLEEGRRFLQQGSVPGATAHLARVKAANQTAIRLLGGFANFAPVQASVELAKGAYLIGKEGARKGHSEAGKQLIKEPLAYQAANLWVSPADALSKYGASREAQGKKAFEERYVNPLNRQIAEEEERKRSDATGALIRYIQETSRRDERDVPSISPKSISNAIALKAARKAFQ